VFLLANIKTQWWICLWIFAC